MAYHKDNRIRKYVQGYGFLSFAEKFGTKYGKKFINKGIAATKRFNENKYGKALKKEGLKFAKISGKQILERAAPVVGDLIGNKKVDKITSLSGKKQEEMQEE